MKKINILKRNEDFNRIISSIPAFKYKDYIIYLEKNTNLGFLLVKKSAMQLLEINIKDE